MSGSQSCRTVAKHACPTQTSKHGKHMSKCSNDIFFHTGAEPKELPTLGRSRAG